MLCFFVLRIVFLISGQGCIFHYMSLQIIILNDEKVKDTGVNLRAIFVKMSCRPKKYRSFFTFFFLVLPAQIFLTDLYSFGVIRRNHVVQRVRFSTI